MLANDPQLIGVLPCRSAAIQNICIAVSGFRATALRPKNASWTSLFWRSSGLRRLSITVAQSSAKGDHVLVNPSNAYEIEQIMPIALAGARPVAPGPPVLLSSRPRLAAALQSQSSKLELEEFCERERVAAARNSKSFLRASLVTTAMLTVSPPAALLTAGGGELKFGAALGAPLVSFALVA